jgi:hypothetical protein
VFEYLNGAGAWGQLVLAGLEDLWDPDSPVAGVEDLDKLLPAVRACVRGSVEVMRSRMEYFVNYEDYGPAEAKMLAELMEQTLTPTVSVAMGDLKETLSDKRSTRCLNSFLNLRRNVQCAVPKEGVPLTPNRRRASNGSVTGR